MSGMDAYLQSAVCLGDLLHDEDYTIVHYGGADHHFGGKGKFLRDHHFDEVWGKNEMAGLLIDKSYVNPNPWGLFDDSLFDIAYERFLRLSESKKKFAVTILTFDTHHPGGHPSESCKGMVYKDGSNPSLNAVACSDYLISDFVQKILSSPYAKNTTIVIMSDHLVQNNKALELLKKGQRTNMFMIIEPELMRPRKITTLGSTLDAGATILPFMGYEGSLGLGRNLLDTKQTSSEIETIQKNLINWRKDILQFWNFPKIKKFIKIDIDNGHLEIDGRKFAIPILLEFNDDFETKLKFDFDRSRTDKTLAQEQGLDKEANFILVDKCANMGRAGKDIGRNDYCVRVGRGEKYFVEAELRKNVTLNTDDLRNLFQNKMPFVVRRIAHAGGGVNDLTYTNSVEALNHSLKKGFKYFELDFSFTKDEQLVCVHDFQQTFTKLTGIKLGEAPMLKEFLRMMGDRSGLHILTLDILAEWMKRNPSAVIITDVKDEDNIKALTEISKKLPSFKSKVIPQIYSPEEFLPVKMMGFKQIIWTLYQYPGTNEDVLKWVDAFVPPFAVAVPKRRDMTQLPKSLRQKNIPTYVYVVNDEEEMNAYFNDHAVAEVYTDYLSPKH